MHTSKTTSLPGGMATETEWNTDTDSVKLTEKADGTRSLWVKGIGMIDPKAPADVVRQQLSTPQRVFLFQRAFATFKTPENPLEFACTFRLSFAEWHKRGFTGCCCNTYAEMAASVLDGHGHETHLITLMPKNAVTKEAWHIAAGIKTKDGRWIIIDEPMASLTYRSPQEHAQDLGMKLVPFVGVKRWSR